MPNRRPRARAGHRSRFKRISTSASKRVPTKHIPPALILEAKRLYTQTNVPVEDICALLGIGTSAFHRRLKLWRWPMRSKRIPKDEPQESPASGELVASADAASPDASSPLPTLPTEVERIALAARLCRLVEAELESREKVARDLGLDPGPAGESAERSRALAALGRTLHTMNILSRARNENAAEPDEPTFRSLEVLGRAISEHLEAMELEPASQVPGAAQAG